MRGVGDHVADVLGYCIVTMTVCFGIYVLITSIKVHHDNQYLAVAKMVEAGADPIAAGCAVGTIVNAALCRGAQD